MIKQLAALLLTATAAYAEPEGTWEQRKPDTLTIQQLDPITWEVDYWNSESQHSGEFREFIEETGCMVSLSVAVGPETLYVNCNNGFWAADKPVSKVFDGSGVTVQIVMLAF